MIALWLLACHGGDDTDTPVSPAHGLVVATTDFSVGALATVDPVEGTVQDTLVATSGDPSVAADGGIIVQIDRSPPAALRLWTPGDWSAPTAEIAVDGAANPQSAVVCGGRLFASELGADAIGVWELDGTPRPPVSLADWADDDGSPEAASLVRIGDRLYVALQELVTTGPQWVPSGPGVVAEIDCNALSVTRTWDTGPDPSISATGDGAALLVRTGIWGEPDGALELLDPTGDGAQSPLLDEATLGFDLGAVAASPRGIVITGAAFDFTGSRVACVEPATSEVTTAATLGNFLPAAAADAAGNVWIAVSIDYADASAPTGLAAYDPGSCTPIGDGLLPTLLPPYAIASY